MQTAIDEMMARINVHNLERIRASCEADGDRELAELIAAKLAAERAYTPPNGTIPVRP